MLQSNTYLRVLNTSPINSCEIRHIAQLNGTCVMKLRDGWHESPEEIHTVVQDAQAVYLVVYVPENAHVMVQ